jgi:DNA-binding transcriptional MerR regulator
MPVKMKEICEKTGLTERAVRLYCERGLIKPESYTQNDREYLVFGERDERALRCIAILSSADFSLEEIQTMQNEPFLIEKTVREHTAKLMKESAEKLELCGRLQALDPTKLRDIVDLAEELGRDEPHSNVSPLKGPTFAEFCEQGGYCEDETLFMEEERLVRRGRIFARCYSVYFVILAVFSSLMSGSFGAFVLSLGLNLVFLIFFVKGYPWARVVLAVLQLLGLFGDLYSVTVGVDYSSFGWWVLLIVIPILAAEVLCCYFLAFDKGVSAYQYEKRTGGDRYL